MEVQFFKGLEANLPQSGLTPSSFYLTTDTNKLFVSNEKGTELAQIGIIPSGDNASITVTSEGLVSIFGFANAENNKLPMKINGSIQWKSLAEIGAGDGNDDTTYTFEINDKGSGIIITPLFNGQPIYESDSQIKYEIDLNVYTKNESDEKFLAKIDYTPYDDSELDERISALEDNSQDNLTLESGISEFSIQQSSSHAGCKGFKIISSEPDPDNPACGWYQLEGYNGDYYGNYEFVYGDSYRICPEDWTIADMIASTCLIKSEDGNEYLYDSQVGILTGVKYSSDRGEDGSLLIEDFSRIYVQWMSGTFVDVDTNYISDDTSEGDENTIWIPTRPEIGDIDIGAYSTALGKSNSATGRYSLAHGSYCQAKGKYSYAGGRENIAYFAAHSEGRFNQSLGQFSHTEGNNNIARGDKSHSEGSNTTANGMSAHAEGNGTLANANRSHAEGEGITITAGALPWDTNTNITQSGAYGKGSHVEGVGSSANGDGAHAEGANACIAYGDGAHAEGFGTIATGAGAHAQGHKTKANGKGAHSSGINSSANKDVSFVHGFDCVVNNTGSVALGRNLVTGRNYQMVVGQYNVGLNSTIFEIGSGDGSERKNALWVDAAGKTYIQELQCDTLSNLETKIISQIDYIGYKLKAPRLVFAPSLQELRFLTASGCLDHNHSLSITSHNGFYYYKSHVLHWTNGTAGNLINGELPCYIPTPAYINKYFANNNECRGIIDPLRKYLQWRFYNNSDTDIGFSLEFRGTLNSSTNYSKFYIDIKSKCEATCYLDLSNYSANTRFEFSETDKAQFVSYAASNDDGTCMEYSAFRIFASSNANSLLGLEIGPCQWVTYDQAQKHTYNS